MELTEKQYWPGKRRLSSTETDNASETGSECHDSKVEARLTNVRASIISVIVMLLSYANVTLK